MVSTRKLQPYFQAHMIVVLTNQPLRTTLHKLNVMSWMAKWTLELIEFDLIFRPQPSIKAQVLVDFVVECTIPDEEFGSPMD